ncbi:MAG: hypothetical protein HC905_10145 [Bacteroidales bacterium]|nr:hypothetical protein [Bacteroidales bacterium]
MTIHNYIDRLNTRFKTGISREHSYRGDLQTLLESISTDVLVLPENKYAVKMENSSAVFSATKVQ